MIRFVLDQLKTKKVCKNAAKKMPFVIKFVIDQYKTQDKLLKFSPP